MIIKIDGLRNNVSYRIPKYVGTTKKRKSTFIDRNAVPTITKDLGNFDYDALQQEENSNIKNEFVFRKPSNENINNAKPVSSFTNESSVFYNEEHNKIFSKIFQLVKRKK